MLYLLFLAICFIGLYNCFDPKQSGTYKTSVLSIGPCDKVGTNQVQFKTRLSRVNKTTLCYSGWLSLPFGLTNEMNEHWDISVRDSTGGWKTNFLTFKHKHACSDTKKLFPQWFQVLEHANLTDTSCPIPKGNYSFDCLDLSNLQFERAPMMMFGRYRVTINYFLNKVHLGCTKYEGELSSTQNASTPQSTPPPSSLVADTERQPANVWRSMRKL